MINFILLILRSHSHLRTLKIMEQRRDSVASDDTFVDLQQVDPSPIDSPLDWDEKLPELPSYTSFGRSSTLGLSGSGHGAVYYRECYLLETHVTGMD